MCHTHPHQQAEPGLISYLKLHSDAQVISLHPTFGRKKKLNFMQFCLMLGSEPETTKNGLCEESLCDSSLTLLPPPPPQRKSNLRLKRGKIMLSSRRQFCIFLSQCTFFFCAYSSTHTGISGPLEVH